MWKPARSALPELPACHNRAHPLLQLCCVSCWLKHSCVTVNVTQHWIHCSHFLIPTSHIAPHINRLGYTQPTHTSALLLKFNSKWGWLCDFGAYSVSFCAHCVIALKYTCTHVYTQSVTKVTESCRALPPLTPAHLILTAPQTAPTQHQSEGWLTAQSDLWRSAHPTWATWYSSGEAVLLSKRREGHTWIITVTVRYWQRGGCFKVCLHYTCVRLCL